MDTALSTRLCLFNAKNLFTEPSQLFQFHLLILQLSFYLISLYLSNLFQLQTILQSFTVLAIIFIVIIQSTYLLTNKSQIILILINTMEKENYYDQQFASLKHFSNQILIVPDPNQSDCLTYFIPVYCRIKLKNIIQMDLQKLTAEVNMDIILSVYYGSLPQLHLQLLKENLVLAFPRDSPVYLSQDSQIVTKSVKKKQHCLGYTVRKILNAQVLNNIRWAPFEQAQIIISVNMKKFKCKISNKNQSQRWIKFKFNFMQIKGQQFNQLKFSIGAQKQFGSYKIAQKKMEVIYDNKYQNPKQQDFLQQVRSSKGYDLNQQTKTMAYSRLQGSRKKLMSKQKIHIDNQQQTEHNMENSRIQSIYLATNDLQVKYSKIDSFQYAYFILPMYKSPYSMAILILLQLALVGAVNICIFFQDIQKSGKQMLNMAALMVALVALLPNIRENMGRSGQVTLAQGCIILQTGTIVLTFAHMINNRDKTFEFDFESVLSGPLIIICIIITGLIFICISTLLLIHHFYWTKTYHYSQLKQQVNWFDRKLWNNQSCDQQILESSDYYLGKIQVLKPPVASVESEKPKKFL